MLYKVPSRKEDYSQFRGRGWGKEGRKGLRQVCPIRKEGGA
uniref:Uncharacterized protein n=1 Tax=Anguilla anguilla TaxID=7936 RepID=A0A0E9WCS5_ANGAN